MERVRASLAEHGLNHLTVREFAASTATASDAAAAIGTTVGRIVKSLVFMAGEQPVLVLASGPNRVDLTKVSRLLGKPITRANADQVRTLTGFAIGGVPPVGHAQPLSTLVDRALLQYDDAVQSGLFGKFVVAAPAYSSERQPDPWIIAEVAGTDCWAVITRWRD